MWVNGLNFGGIQRENSVAFNIFCFYYFKNIPSLSQRDHISIKLQGDIGDSTLRVALDARICDTLSLLKDDDKSRVWLVWGTKPLRPHLTWSANSIPNEAKITVHRVLPGGMINKPDEGEDINAISLPTAPPPYFLDTKGSPQGWLDIIEMRFRIQKLTNQVAMFHHALCVLPPELM